MVQRSVIVQRAALIAPRNCDPPCPLTLLRVRLPRRMGDAVGFLELLPTNMKTKLLMFFASILVASALALTDEPDAVPSKVFEWKAPGRQTAEAGARQPLINGSTLDLERLEVSVETLDAGQSTRGIRYDDLEAMVIVKSGALRIAVGGQAKSMGPGSVAVFLPGDAHDLANAGKEPVSYYLFKYKTKTPMNLARGKKAGGSFMVDWNEVPFQATPIGGRRQNFDRATAMFEQFEMHVSTLNAGLTNHPIHTHRAEEIALMISGQVEMWIADGFKPANAGDVIFLASGIPHSLRNIGKEKTEYFAFQWR